MRVGACRKESMRRSAAHGRVRSCRPERRNRTRGTIGLRCTHSGVRRVRAARAHRHRLGRPSRLQRPDGRRAEPRGCPCQVDPSWLCARRARRSFLRAGADAPISPDRRTAGPARWAHRSASHRVAKTALLPVRVAWSRHREWRFQAGADRADQRVVPRRRPPPLPPRMPARYVFPWAHHGHRPGERPHGRRAHRNCRPPRGDPARPGHLRHSGDFRRRVQQRTADSNTPRAGGDHRREVAASGPQRRHTVISETLARVPPRLVSGYPER
jgi:hypothetical protein